ncbi:DUF262 domain-containing protein [Helicobacter sp. MIT 01-3238]|uniref:HNH endonuclease family protein n=1 Tax=Helicobacter sp. MIT 01-3238 TaxID=398627 RepID=UPI000E1F3EAB|nr:DUF262 domain-containing protein [Helicobacter sp. MIT 01-3238]RDU51608.1 HNH endonuclease [Helicobacter sp. MIT 01-3238]
MKIELQKIKIKELVEGYERDEESGAVLGYNKNLNIRPPYQREFVYKDKQRDEVIRTIFKGFPLNSIYWVKNGEDSYEVLDGQQRTISICDYHNGVFSVDEQYFHNLAQDKKEQFLHYELMVYVCEGEESEKLEWFRVINIAGEKLTDQELRNAIYVSAWLSDAKRRFSKRNSLAEQKGGRYLKGESLRQEYLESAIAWRVNKRDDKAICEYMGKNAKDSKNADELWGYFCAVIDWVEMKFPKYRKEMKGLEWGIFYNKYKDKPLDATELEAKIAELMQDSEVQKKSGIYEYVLSGDEKCLNLRAFDENIKREVYERQGGICANKKCPNAGQKFEIGEMEADHIKAWSKGGKTTIENCQMLCRECNRTKGAK